MSLMYYQDDDGLVWGPFTPALMTLLFNRRCITMASRIRIEGEVNWIPYSKAKVALEPIAGNHDEIIRKGKDEANRLQLHVATKKGPEPKADPLPPPGVKEWLIGNDFGLAYAGHFRHDSGMVRLEMVYLGSGETKAHVFLPDRDHVAEQLGVQEHGDEIACAYNLQIRESIQKHIAAKKIISSELRDQVAMEVKNDVIPFTLYLFQYDRVMSNQDKSKEFFLMTESATLINGMLVRIAYSFPKYAVTLEEGPMFEFMANAAFCIALS